MITISGLNKLYKTSHGAVPALRNISLQIDKGDIFGIIGLSGAGAKNLGNIKIGDGSKIASGSVVLNEVPPHSTVAGIPARVVGKPKFADPGRQMEQNVEFGFCI